MTWLRLTDPDGNPLYINMRNVLAFRPSTTSAAGTHIHTILTKDGAPRDLEVKETPAKLATALKIPEM